MINTSYSKSRYTEESKAAYQEYSKTHKKWRPVEEIDSDIAGLRSELDDKKEKLQNNGGGYPSAMRVVFTLQDELNGLKSSRTKESPKRIPIPSFLARYINEDKVNGHFTPVDVTEEQRWRYIRRWYSIANKRLMHKIASSPKSQPNILANEYVVTYNNLHKFLKEKFMTLLHAFIKANPDAQPLTPVRGHSSGA